MSAVAAEKLYTEIGLSLKNSEQSQMFGKPCFKIGGKAFVCFFESCMVFKLTGDTHKEALALKGSVLFDPSGKGRAMKEWIQVPYSSKTKWAGYAEVALKYVNGK